MKNKKGLFIILGIFAFIFLTGAIVVIVSFEQYRDKYTWAIAEISDDAGEFETVQESAYHEILVNKDNDIIVRLK